MEGNRICSQRCEEEEYSKRVAEAEELEERTRKNDGIKDYKVKVRPLHHEDSEELAAPETKVTDDIENEDED